LSADVFQIPLNSGRNAPKMNFSLWEIKPH
jgi:hypothetical protein